MFKVPNKFRLKPEEAEGLAKMWKKEPRQLVALATVTFDEEENQGLFVLPNAKTLKGKFFYCIASTGQGWNHISVHIPSERRCPTWEEMCFIKDQFWSKEAAVVQFHPPENEYVNNHNFCLHLWEPNEGQIISRPPSILVGLK